MVEIGIVVKADQLKRLAKERTWIRVRMALRHDMITLGNAGHKYLKTLIPMSKVKHPHLRSSFKRRTKVLDNSNILLTISTPVYYSDYLNSGTVVSDRYNRNKKAMVFTIAGKKIFTKRARGFTTHGIKFIGKTESWLFRHAYEYVDVTLKKYLG